MSHNVPENEYYELSHISDGYRKRDSITAYGFPGYNVGDPLHEIDAQITAVTTISAVRRIVASSLLNQGLSGGPVLDSRYNAIGVVHKGGTSEPRQLTTCISEVQKLYSVSVQT